jgi:hypothetical protein
LEDRTRNMEPKKVKVRSAQSKTDRKNRLTIIIMGRFGKVRSFKISPITLLVVCIFLFLYIPGTLIVTNNYIDLRHEYRVQNETLERQGKDLIENRNQLAQSQEHEALLEDYIRNLQIPKSKSIGSTTIKQEHEEKPQVAAEKSHAVAEKPQAVAEKPPFTAEKPQAVAEKTQVVKEETPEHAVDIQDMTIKKEGSLITVELKLVNTDPGGKKIGGFIHILAVADSTDQSQIWVYPRQKMENGLPMDFRHGELFIMKRFRPITGKIYLLPEGNTPSIIRVLLYDQSGEIMLEKEFEVKDGS